MAKKKLVFNPFIGNFEYIIEPDSKGEIIKGILVEQNESTGQVAIIFDENSILYEDDEFKA